MAYQKDASRRVLNTTEIVDYLHRSFHRAVSNSSIQRKATRTINGYVNPTELYYLQVDFCYLVDHITRGPAYIAPKYIQDANDLIAKIDGGY